jgi:hypothetical protein
MNDFGENVKNYLLQFNAMPANHLTHALKQISGSEDGTMVDGLIEIVDRLISDKKRSTTTAFFVGSIGTAFAGSFFWIHSKHREKKKHEEECQKIIRTFENEIAMGKSDTNPLAEKACPNTENAMIYG